MNIRWKTASILVGLNVTMALFALVILGQSDPNWIENPPQTAETSSQETVIKLAGVIPGLSR